MTGLADCTDGIASIDPPPLFDALRKPRQMRITRGVTAGMLELYHETVAGARTGKLNRTRSDRHDRRSMSGLIIYRFMGAQHTGDRIAAGQIEGRGDLLEL
jgi:hypothetical protein